MARSHKGRPVPVRLARLIVADVALCELFAIVCFAPLYLFFSPNADNLPLVGSLIFYSLGLALLMLQLSIAMSLRGRFARFEAWVREGYELAKARPCLLINPNRMGAGRSLVSAILALPFMALWMWVFRFLLIAVAMQIDFAGAFTTKAVIFFLVLTIALPVLVCIWRLSVYLVANWRDRLARG